MQANPILAETIRGNWVENIHRGAFCVTDSRGKILALAGDVQRAIFPRSAIKSMQAVAMFRSGAVEKFALDDEMIALACASHIGDVEHVEGIAHFLDRIGCAVTDLECGTHMPVSKKMRKTLRERGADPTAIHNNCSGKHAGMLAVAKALGVSTTGYSERDHPVQQLVRASVEDLIGERLTEDRCGTDGCSIPTWAASLKVFATGFARMAAGEGRDSGTSAMTNRIIEAATAHPILVRGADTLDSDLMAAFGGRLMIKIGAEGVFCGGLRDREVGFALKVDDGNMKAAEAIVSALLMAIAQPNATELSALKRYDNVSLKNWRKLAVATISATGAAKPEL